MGPTCKGKEEGEGPTPKAKRGVISPLPQSRLVEINTVKLEIPAVGIVRFVLATYSFSVTCNLLPADLT